MLIITAYRKKQEQNSAKLVLAKQKIKTVASINTEFTHIELAPFLILSPASRRPPNKLNNGRKALIYKRKTPSLTCSEFHLVDLPIFL